MKRIVVCLKQVLDPEIPAKEFQLDAENLRPNLAKPRLVMDSYGENALELAVQIKGLTGAEVVVVSVGDRSAEEVLRSAIAIGADKAIRVWDESFAMIDAGMTAQVLARTVDQIGGADLVLCGRQSGDVEQGLVGPLLAEELQIPCIVNVELLSITEAGVQVQQESDSGKVVLRANLPLVATISSDASTVIRLAKVRDLLVARRAQIQVLGPADLGATVFTPMVRIERLGLPVAQGQGEILAGETGEEKAQLLIRRLQELKLV